MLDKCRSYNSTSGQVTKTRNWLSLEIHEYKLEEKLYSAIITYIRVIAKHKNSYLPHYNLCCCHIYATVLSKSKQIEENLAVNVMIPKLLPCYVCVKV